MVQILDILRVNGQRVEGVMSKLLNGIEIVEKERKLNTKASESYIPVRFRYDASVWE